MIITSSTLTPGIIPAEPVHNIAPKECKVSNTSSNKIWRGIEDRSKSLYNRFVRWTKEAARWLKSVLLKILSYFKEKPKPVVTCNPPTKTLNSKPTPAPLKSKTVPDALPKLPLKKNETDPKVTNDEPTQNPPPTTTASTSTTNPKTDTPAPKSLFPLLEPHTPQLESGRNLLLGFIENLASIDEAQDYNLLQAVQFCVEFTESETKLDEQQKEHIRQFFNRLKTRTSIPPEDIALYLSKRTNLQRILSPRLDELLKIKNPNREQQLEINLAKGELATSFGYGIVSAAGGKNGAVFIKTFEGDPVGVFKAPQELGVLDFIEKAKQFLGQARLLNQEPMAQEYAEVVASDLCQLLEFENMAPESIMAKFGEEKGAYIAFLDGYQELAKIREGFDKRTDFTNGEIRKWQMMAIWNFLVGNLDPHDENIFVIIGSDGKLEDIRMIDHGNCFPISNPGYWGSKGNLGAWGNFSISKRDFLPEVLTFITEKINQEALQTFFGGNEQRKNFFKPEMKKLQLERARVLTECVATKEISTPAQLALIKTDNHYQKYLK